MRLVAKTTASTPLRLQKTQLHRIARALADPTRFEIFQQIAAGRCLACSEIRDRFPVTAPTISHHLKELEAAELIESTRAGKFMNLKLRREIWQAYLRELAQI